MTLSVEIAGLDAHGASGPGPSPPGHAARTRGRGHSPYRAPESGHQRRDHAAVRAGSRRGRSASAGRTVSRRAVSAERPAGALRRSTAARGFRLHARLCAGPRQRTRRPAQARRPDYSWQDQYSRVRPAADHGATPVRAHTKSLGHQPHAGRLQRRLRCRRSLRHGRHGARERWWRLAAHSGILLRRLRTETDARPQPTGSRLRRSDEWPSCRARAHSLRARQRGAAGRDFRARHRRSLLGAGPGASLSAGSRRQSGTIAHRLLNRIADGSSDPRRLRERRARRGPVVLRAGP